MTANCITVSRILFSLCLFLLPPSSVPFAVLYLLCGLTDMLDGFIARKLHIESRAGELLDSIADLFFAVAYVVKIVPLLYLPKWIIIWTAIIAAVKTIGIIMASITDRKLYIRHSFANKLTGLTVFILPLIIRSIDVKAGAVIACVAATAAVFEEITDIMLRYVFLRSE